MLSMVLMVAVFAFFGTSVDALNWDGLRAHWAMNPRDGFYALPLNVDDAKKQSWTELKGADSNGIYTVLSYKGDPRCALYFSKKTGFVQGVQINVPVKDAKMKGMPINYDDYTGVYKKKIDNVDYYSSSIFFRLDGNNSGGPRLWIRDQKGTHIIPTDTNALVQKTSFKKKGCIPTMGTHYYQFGNSQGCIKTYPWFLLGDGKDVIGFGFAMLGRKTRSTARDWFEEVISYGIRLTLPDAPQCLLKTIDDYGLILLHFWLGKNIPTVSCK